VKLEFFNRSFEDRALIIQEIAARRNLPLAMVEKDFWVCWTLAALFENPELGSHLVFKGGTSLSKVFGVIARFSEDIDLSVSPEFLGITEASLEENVSKQKKRERMDQLEAACIEGVRERFLPALERLATEALGRPVGRGDWMEFHVDSATHSPVILFHYPTARSTDFQYLPRYVKLEFGSLTDQRPVGLHAISPWLAEDLPKLFPDFRCNPVALELERTFWEKATILHSEFHRDAAKPMRDRFSRHYSDMAALAQHESAHRSLARFDLRQRVVDWKSRFFASAWSRYDLATTGTFRLVPPQFRIAELEKDYAAMRDMFITNPPNFDFVLSTLSELESRINKPA
jgi:hypothetical protein